MGVHLELHFRISHRAYWLELSICRYRFHGSILMRPHGGSAAMMLAAGFSSDVSGGEHCGEDGPSLPGLCLPSEGTDKGGDAVRQFLGGLGENSWAVPEYVCMASYFQCDAFWLLLFLFPGVASKPKWRNVSFIVEAHAIEEREIGVHAMPQAPVTELVSENRRKAGSSGKQYTKPRPQGRWCGPIVKDQALEISAQTTDLG